MNSLNDYISYPLLILLVIISGALVLGGKGVTDLVGILLILLSICGNLYTLLAFFLFPILKLANPVLIQGSSVVGLGFWLMLFLGVFRNLSTIFNGNYLRTISPMWYFLCSAFISSFFYSHNVEVSLLKLISFIAAVITIVAISSNLNSQEVVQFEKFIITIMLFIVVFSIPCYFFQSIGFVRNGKGFQGVFNHPQAFAIFLAPVFSYLLMSFFQLERRSNYLFTSFSLGVLWLLIKTKARTALLASSLSVIIPILFTIINNTRYIFYIHVNKFLIVSLTALISVGSSLYYSDTFYKSVDAYIFKDEKKETLSDAFYKSRGANVENHYQNFLKSPWFGWGFGVEAYKMHINPQNTILGLPISAPIEKGFLISAVLEETGCIGFILFLFWIMRMIHHVAIKEKPIYLSCFLTCILVNFGEAVFFSVGGLGLMFWVIMGFLLTRNISAKN